VGSYVSNLQIIIMGRGCITSYNLVWDPGDFTTYRQVPREVHMEGLCGQCVGTYGGVYDLSAK
jgi:hypothetical protein